MVVTTIRWASTLCSSRFECEFITMKMGEENDEEEVIQRKFRKGDYIKVSKLVKAKAHNGKPGLVLGFDEEEIPFAEMFVAMSLGADGESIEVKQLLHR